MPTINEDLFHGSVRHQIRVRRYAGTVAVAILAVLEKADRELTRLLRDRLSAMGGKFDLKGKRWESLLSDIRDSRKEVFTQIKAQAFDEFKKFSDVEVAAEVAALAAVLPAEVKVASVSAAEAWTASKVKPVAGSFMQEWFKHLADTDQKSIQRAVQMGVAQGEAIPDIMRRVAGSAANAFRDGTLATTRRQVESVVRTVVNHISNEAREAVWEANSDILVGLRWTSVLDGRTTMICMSRDGMIAPIGDKSLPDWAVPLEPPDARPPAHWNCRSVMTAVIDGEEVLGERPYVTDTRGRKEREVDFKAQAKETGRTIKEVRSAWADENIGQAPGETTYQTWLGQQTAAFQDEVLGPARGSLFRSGKLSLSQFVDSSGKTLTLDQL